ncbi:MAG: hypothetical protein K6F80_06160 [Oscillospiraceae bacterium]|nr:hypothetical protein [Oscillospiraceae bacterium]
MKHRTILAAVFALVMLTSTACGSKNESAVMTNADIPAAPAVQEEAADDAISEKKMASPAEAAGAAADDGGDYEAPAIYADREAMADAAGVDVLNSAALKSFSAMDAADGSLTAAEPVPDKGAADVIDEDDYSVDGAVTPEPRQLTAGEWRDHDNWGFFSNLVNAGTIEFPSFGIDPCHRVSVELKDGAGAPLANADVVLLDKDGGEIWKSVTDKNGIAYLFETAKQHGVSVKAVSGGAEVTADVPASADGTQGDTNTCTDRSVSMTLDTAAVVLDKTQVMFIVDTTGSMGDEMLYLQSDFASIAEEVGDAGTMYSALFYKDVGDTYVTRSEGFTSDVNALKKQLNKEVADGGGDEPEAVAEAFTEAFVNENWDDGAVKIAFLIYDAPPHDEKSEELLTAIESASEKGIRLVPVVSSNGSRETELFGRACAICTNGSYVFLTDDSGIGGSHLEPIIGDYEVEKLHDIIVRIIQDYKQA